MSGCCGQGPVIVSGAAAAPRLDVETVVLCDVLPDGTVAGIALVEPIYDTNTGARISTRTVDPVTGAAYTPTGTLGPCAPDGCTATTTSQILCDTAGDGTVTHFVRAVTYDCEGALLATLDRTLDGDPYTVTGTAGVCPTSPDCESPTTPVTSVGLCLADGTPIAVTVIRDCAGATTAEGWINLITGAWSAGAVPAGAVACGDSQSIQVSGTFCDVDEATGDVLGLVLVEYTYDEDGAIAAVRLVDAVTGGTYTPTGTVTVCPAGVEQPERDLLQLCDTATDGTVTEFVRDYARDENGAITGHSDYGLDGAPYTPSGTVGACNASVTCETFTLCDSSPVPVELGAVALEDPSRWRTLICPTCAGADNPTLPGGLQPLFDGGSVAVPLTPTSAATGSHHWAAGALTAASCSCPDAEVTLTVSVDFLNNGPAAQQGGGTGVFLYNGDTLVGSDGTLAAAGATDTLTVTGTVPLADVQAGNVVLLFQVEGGQQGSQKTWTLSNFQVEATTDCGRSFLRTVCRDAAGEVVSQTDTLDGITPYVPEGDVQPCSGPEAICPGGGSGSEECRNSSTVLVCDVPADGSTSITPTIVDGTLADVGQTQFQTHPGPWAPLWSGGTFIYPAGAGPTQEHLGVVGQITADMADCEGAAGTLTISVRVRNDGPTAGQAWDGALRLFRGTTGIATHNALEWAPVGWQGTLTVSAPVTAADIAAGDIRVALLLETYHLGAKSWTADQFTASLELEGCEASSSTQFLRTLVTDCETGEVVSTTDTTLDGQPYTVTGEVGQCTPASTVDECRDCEQTVLCDVTEEGTTAFLRTVCRDCTGAVVSTLDTELDGTSPYAPVGTVGRCCDTQVLAQCTYSLPDTSTALSLTDPAYPGCWLGTGGAASYTYGDRVTSWAAVYQSDTGSASVALFSSPDLGGAISFAAFTPALPVNPAQSAPGYVGTAVINGITVTLTATGGNGLGIWQANPTGLYLGGDDAFRLDFSEPVRLTVNASGFADPPTLHERFCGVTAVTVPWPALRLADCDGNVTTVDPDTREPIPATAVVTCQASDCETTAVQTIRLCDLDPTVEPDEDGRRCAVPFLRHLAYDCAGELAGFHDTALDGTTPYTPTQVVDCQCESGQGLTSSIEVPWQVVSVVEDPAGTVGQDFIYTVAPETDLTRLGTIRVHVSRPAGGACGAYDINALVFSNTSAYTLTLDAVAQEMSYLRVDLVDFDTFEPVAVNTAYPLPNRLGGTAGWNATNTRIVPSENNGTGYMYWDNPPETVGWSVLNQGGGVSCSALSFQGMTVEPGGCCGGSETSGCSECGPVNTGVRSATGTAAQDLAAEFPDLQSVSLAVLAGTVNVTMTDGTDVPIPAGVTLTWSVSKDTDTALAAASFAGADASASYLLNWTYS